MTTQHRLTTCTSIAYQSELGETPKRFAAGCLHFRVLLISTRGSLARLPERFGGGNLACARSRSPGACPQIIRPLRLARRRRRRSKRVPFTDRRPIWRWPVAKTPTCDRIWPPTTAPLHYFQGRVTPRSRSRKIFTLQFNTLAQALARGTAFRTAGAVQACGQMHFVGKFSREKKAFTALLHDCRRTWKRSNVFFSSPHSIVLRLKKVEKSLFTSQQTGRQAGRQAKSFLALNTCQFFTTS